MNDRIHALFRQTETWRAAHARAGRMIEAAACAIRIRALRDALAIAEGSDG